ncbi:MAG: class I adenylate-forming enzyme family protein [Myxococcota bacterium]
MQKLLFDLLLTAAKHHPDRVAFIDGDRRIRYAELLEQAQSIARGLADRGLSAGDRVAIVHESDLESVAFFWAIQAIGATSVDVPHHVSAETLAQVLEEAAPAAILIGGAEQRRLGDKKSALPPVVFGSKKAGTVAEAAQVSFVEDLIAAHGKAPPRGGAADDVAVIIYTSGTTGVPKGVMLSHNNLLSNIHAASELFPLGPDDRLLLAVPTYFVHGRMQILSLTHAGGSIVLSAGFAFPERVVEELANHEITLFSGVPFHFTTLLERTSIAQKSLPKLKHLLITGGALPFGVLRRLHTAVPEAGIHTAYGMTEAAPRLTYLGPKETLEKKDCAGRPLPGLSVEILGSDGLPLPRGAVGEVAARGPNIMKGYVSGDERSSGRIDAEGRLRTGDLGRLDGDGYLYLFGRQSDMIKTAGERIFPGELEEILLKHPAVREAAVFGAPDPILGERVVAVVVLKEGRSLSKEELHRHNLGWVPFVRAPREIHLRTELPKTASGKVDKKALRAAIAAG